MPETSAEQRAADIVSAGGVIAFRTDTFYGLGADPLNATAVQRIWELKGREQGKPILLLISDREQIARFISSPTRLFNELAESFWPGPLTLIGRARQELPPELTAGTGTIGLRLPDEARVRVLVRACGGALTATSANLAIQPPARNAAEIRKYFGDAIDLVLDDGEVDVTVASTVVDATGQQVRIIREGLVREAQLLRTFS